MQLSVYDSARNKRQGLTYYDKMSMLFLMKKIVVFLTLIILSAGAFCFLILPSKANETKTSLKSDVFFVSENQVLKFESVFEHFNKEQVLSNITLLNADVLLQEDGFLAVSVGIAHIEYNTNEKKQSFQIIIKESIEFVSKSFQFSNLKIEGFVGETFPLFENSTNRCAILLKESNNICEANLETNQLTLIKSGTCSLNIIIATSENSYLTKTISVISNQRIFATTIECESNLYVSLMQPTFQLPFLVNPTEFNQALRIKSLQPNIAQVDDSGLVTLLQEGSLAIEIEAQSSLSAWIRILVNLHVQMPLQALSIEVMDEQGVPIEMIDKNLTELRLQIKIPITLTPNMTLFPRTNTEFVPYAPTTILKDSVIFYLQIDSLHDVVLFCELVQTFVNGRYETITSNNITLMKEREPAFFDIAFNDLQVDDDTQTILYFDAMIDLKELSKKTIFVTKNFEHDLIFEISNQNIVLENQTIIAKNFGQATITISDPFEQVAPKLIKIEVLPFFVESFDNKPIRITAWNEEPFLNHPLSFDLHPTLTKQIAVTSKNNLFSYHDALIKPLSEGNDTAIIRYENIDLLEIPVVIERITARLHVFNQIDNVALSEENNYVFLDRSNNSEILLLVSLETSLVETYHYNVAVYNLDHSSSTLDDHGMIYRKPSPIEFNRVSMFASIATQFVFRIYLLELPEIYFDVIVLIS